MTTGGWITMIVSLCAVFSGVFWCFRRVLQSPQDERVPPGFGP